MKLYLRNMLISLVLFMTSAISLHAQTMSSTSHKQCTPLSKQYPELGTEQSVSAKKRFTTVWGSYELPGGPCGYPSAEEHYKALLKDVQSRGGPTKHTHASLPDWGGHWGTENNTGEIVLMGINSTLPGMKVRLTPAARKQFEQDLSMWEKDQAIDPVGLCLPPHFPRWFSLYGYREHFLTPDKSLLGAEMMNEFRRIFTDGRSHPSSEWMTSEWLGYSIGFWDGDVLTIWTKGIKQGLMTRQMPRTSNELEIIERWRKVDPVAAGLDIEVSSFGGTHIPNERMEIEVTLYDPGFVEPWHTVVAFYKEDDRTPELKQQTWPHQWDCVAGSNWYLTDEGVASQYAPGEKPDITKPEFWFNKNYIHR